MAQRKGFKDVYIAKITTNTEDTYTAAEPIKLFIGIGGKTKYSYDKTPVYGDDMEIENDVEFKGGNIELEGMNISPEQLAVIYGYELNKGMIVANKDDVGSDVAIGYRSKNSDGTYHFYWHYVCNFVGDEEADFETISEKSKRQQVKLKGTIKPRLKDGNLKVEIDESFLTSENTEAKALLEIDSTKKIIKWFTAVAEPIASSL